MQSRAFLSQLSVTGDESGFFYVLSQRYYNSIGSILFPYLFFSIRSSNSTTPPDKKNKISPQVPRGKADFMYICMES